MRAGRLPLFRLFRLGGVAAPGLSAASLASARSFWRRSVFSSSAVYGFCERKSCVPRYSSADLSERRPVGSGSLLPSTTRVRPPGEATIMWRGEDDITHSSTTP